MIGTPTGLFLRAFAFTIGIEGALSKDPTDAGNWTGGKVNEGELKGTKFGISAASYPHLDIESINWQQAQEIYYRDYWLAAGCDRLPNRLGIAVFDAAVNHGVKRAVLFLQEAVGTEQDGIIGPATIAAAKSKDQDEVIIDALRIRLDFYRSLKIYPRFGKGWQRRVLKLCMECAR